MNKICKKCNGEFPTTIEIDGKIRNLQQRKFCLKCSPFGKRNTKDLTTCDTLKKDRSCPRCKEIKPLEEFYDRRGGKGNSVYCKSCTTAQTLERQRNFKKLCVEYKGGKCEHCGYDKCINALEFHHEDPNEKEFSPSKYRHYSITILNESVHSELDKCKLLCANCHREEHARINGTFF